MTAKEALKDLREVRGWNDNEYNKRLDIVETTLKDYELVKQAKIIVVDKKISDDDLEQLKNQRMFVSSAEQCEVKLLFDEETQKKLKVLEIIKEKKVAVNILLMSENAHVYNELYDVVIIPSGRTPKYEWKLTETEFNLLKEYLK